MWAFVFTFLYVPTISLAFFRSNADLFDNRMITLASSGPQYFNLYLKDAGYSVTQTNTLPTAGSAESIFASILFGWIADTTGSRLVVTNTITAILLMTNIILSVWNVPKAALLAAYYLSYIGSTAQPILIVRLFICSLAANNGICCVLWLWLTGDSLMATKSRSTTQISDNS